jgi:mRNA interferase ChpB
MRRAGTQQGTIVLITLDPTAGSQIRGTRPVLVLSNQDFNKGGRALVAPITQCSNFERVAGLAVTLIGCGTTIQGAVVISQCRVLDLAARGAKRIEAVPDDVLDDCLAKLEAITAR